MAKDKNKKGKTIDIDKFKDNITKEYAEVLTELKKYDEKKDVDKIKEALAHIYDINTRITNKLKKINSVKKYEDDVKYLKSLLTRSNNEINKYTKIIKKQEPKFDLPKYYLQSDYYKNSNKVDENGELPLTQDDIDESAKIMKEIQDILNGKKSKRFLKKEGLQGSTNRENAKSYLMNYLSDNNVALADSIVSYLEGMTSPSAAQLKENIYSVVSDNLYGIEGMPYQFSAVVDRRIDNTRIGRKFADKIFAKTPLLFITPCTAAFMQGFNRNDKATIASLFMSKPEGDDADDFASLVQGQGKFYSPIFAYDSYYKYLNLMLNCVAVFLGIGNVEVKLGNKQKPFKLSEAQWQYDLNDDFKSFFSAKENLVFYMDSFNQVSQSVSNSYGESSLASTINGFSDTMNEIKFLFNADSNAIEGAIGGLSSIVSNAANALSPIISKLGGGIVGSLASSGINTILNGGKIIFPQVWQDSSMDESFSVNFKFRSPDHDTLSIFMNVLKPYCKLLALTMPHQDATNPNSYAAPFLVKAYSKGMFNIDLGAIAALNVTKGDECQWNNDGLPTQIDVSIDIQNLYSHLAMNSYDDGTLVNGIMKNTAYLDFLCNMAGLNIAQMEFGRRWEMRKILTLNRIKSIDDHIFNWFDVNISNLIGRLWDM